MTESKSSAVENVVPNAIAKPKSKANGIPGLVFVVVMVAAAFAIYAAYKTRTPDGIDIVIRFPEGSGLKVGDPLRHRGVQVGEVTQITLSEDLETVNVHARLDESARLLATAGTRYWIVKVEASLLEFKGLETILSGQYIAVDPSRRRAEQCTEFDGLARQPAIQLPGDSLEIVLETEDASGIRASTPILFRGLEVGQVQSIGLAPDSRFVRIFASINANYSSLIRRNTVFWNQSGFKLNMGISGVDVETATLPELTAGGIGFATPEPPGPPVAVGHRFQLQPKADEEWKQWSTSIATGPGLRLDMQTLPAMQQAALRWKTSFYGWKSSKQREGWVLFLSDGTILGPADLFQAPKDSIPESITFECAGRSWRIDEVRVHSSTQSKLRQVQLSDLPSGVEAWPTERLQAESLEGVRKGAELLLCEGNQRYIPIERNMLSIKKDSIALNPADDLPLPLHGAAILDLSTKQLIGMVVVDEDAETTTIEPLPR